MSVLFDAVLVRFPKSEKVYLFKAPGHTYLKEGDLVKVEHRGDDGVVVKAVTIYEHCEDDFDTLLKATGAREPLARVKAYYKRNDVNWEEEENERN